MPKKICLLSDHHLCINPRLWKEAFFYEKEGFEVVVITMWLSDDLLLRDKDLLLGHSIEYKCYLNIIPGQVSQLSRFYYRLRKKVAGEVQRYLKVGTVWAISYAPELLFKEALRENADLYSAHLECGFLAGRELIKAGKKVSFDFEDWYSHDYLSADRATGLLKEVEDFALQHGIFCTATSEVMANALMQSCTNAKKVTTIYNSFPDEELNDFNLPTRNSIDPFRIVWTSRTVGPERGLETFLEALAFLNQPIELHIIGKCADGYGDFLKANWPGGKGHKLILQDFVKHADHLKIIACFDLGLAIEQYVPDSRNKTITNKILQYLQAGVKVLATDTQGQKEVATYFPQFVSLIPANKPEIWADQISRIIESNNLFNRIDCQVSFRESFSWPIQEKKLKELISENL